MPDELNVTRGMIAAELQIPWVIIPQWLESFSMDLDSENQAVAVYDGQPLDDTAFIEMRGSIAIVHITGVISRRGGYFSRYFRFPNIDQIAKDFRTAMDSPKVKGILLNIDSPGGQVNGTNEFADHVYEARQVKPVWTYSNALLASAAYWIGSAAERLVIDATTEVGSIGVARICYDWRKADEEMGLREIVIVSSASPKKMPDPATKSGQDQIRTTLDGLTDVFISAVARNRGVSEEIVRSDFGRGDLFVGQRAVDAGMVDGLGSFEGTLAEMMSSINPKREGIFMPQANEDGIQITRESVVRDHPEIAEALKKEGYDKGYAAGVEAGSAEGLQAGQDQETARIQAIEALGIRGHDDLVAKAKFEERLSSAELAEAVLIAEHGQRKSVKTAMDQDSEETNGIAPSGDPQSGGDAEKSKILAAAAAGLNPGKRPANQVGGDK